MRQCILLPTGKIEKVQHKRRKEPVLVRLFTHVNRTMLLIPKAGRRRLQQLMRQMPRGAHDIINRYQHYSKRLSPKRSRAVGGPMPYFTTIHMLMRAINAGWSWTPIASTV